MRYICECVDHIGILSYLSMTEEYFEDGDLELIVTPTYNKSDAYKFNDRDSAEQATKQWLLPNLTWTVKEVE